MKKLSKMNLKANAILSGSEMKKVKGGIDCYRSGTNSVFTTDSIRVAGAHPIFLGGNFINFLGISIATITGLYRLES